ncbi:PP2C family protein-serine/threonine phosphatase [Streptomyces sp. NPDC056161]|uniref:PP2C family protein-serine/threonine phosphatase n=1 Tax=Streptomyces sp. NPDC056161 TaxID=3345732 RepID=UPI0035DAA3FF
MWSIGAGEAEPPLTRLVDHVFDGIVLQESRVELAAALQRHMLPPELPQLPRLRIAACYAPAWAGLDVGGDWYDAFILHDGSVGLTLGDVEGHDVEAAAVMGQIRTSLRAVADMTPDPGQVLSRSNDLLVAMRCERFATCCFARFDPESGDLAVSHAGDIPMLWAPVGGECEFSHDETGMPLGILPRQRYEVAHRRLDQAGALIMFTDGVVEGPDFPIESGLSCVTETLSAGFAEGPDVVAARVLQIADLTGHNDDAAVLVALYDPAANER